MRPLRSGHREVYLAEHPRLPRREALKILAAEASADDELLQRSTARPTWWQRCITRTSSAWTTARRVRRLGRVSQFSGAHAGVNDCTGQQDAAEVGQGVFVVAGRDAAPLLEPVEAALDGVA